MLERPRKDSAKGATQGTPSGIGDLVFLPFTLGGEGTQRLASIGCCAPEVGMHGFKSKGWK